MDCIGNMTINDQNETVCPEEWMTFRTGEELETAGSFFTDDQIYSGDGYVYDFSLRLQPDEFLEEFYGIVEKNWWNNRISMWSMTLNAYAPAIDRFVVIQMQFDFSMTGVITPSQLKIIVFSLDQTK